MQGLLMSKMVRLNCLRKRSLSYATKIALTATTLYLIWIIRELNLYSLSENSSGRSIFGRLGIDWEEESVSPQLNIHRWYGVCGNTIDSLRGYALFPKYPHLHTYINVTKMRTSLTNFGDRIFGYLNPVSTGLYKLAVAADGMAEVWLSSDASPNNTRLICQVGGLIRGQYIEGYTGFDDFEKYASQRSEDIYMEGGKKYFLEILYKQGEGDSHLHVAWRIPGLDKFVTISSNFFSLFGREDHYQHLRSHYANSIDKPNTAYRKNYMINKTIAPLPLFRKTQTKLALCGSNGKMWLTLKRYQGVWMTLHPNIYPPDSSEFVIQSCQDQKYPSECEGNPVLNKKEAVRMARKYLESVGLISLSLKSIVRVEEAIKEDGNRYFFLELILVHKKRLVRIADHVIYKNNSFFCKPSANLWNPDVTIYIIITVKNQGSWLRHFVDNMVAIMKQAGEKNLYPIIVDFESKDIDVEECLRSSELEEYTVVHMKGEFHKTAGINRAAETVKDNNSIVFQLDLHLDIPLHLMTLVRKHTIQGYMAFVPLLTRLSCGSSPDFPSGAWEDYGYGLFATYKSDWVRFGGMNELEFSNSWGGEDWEMVDRVIMHGIIIQRIKVPGLFHYYHRKDKMWDNV